MAVRSPVRSSSSWTVVTNSAFVPSSVRQVPARRREGEDLVPVTLEQEARRNGGLGRLAELLQVGLAGGVELSERVLVEGVRASEEASEALSALTESAQRRGWDVHPWR